MSCRAFGLRCSGDCARVANEPRTPLNSRNFLSRRIALMQAGQIRTVAAVDAGRVANSLNLHLAPEGHSIRLTLSISRHETNRRSRTLFTSPSIINTDNMLDPP